MNEVRQFLKNQYYRIRNLVDSSTSELVQTENIILNYHHIVPDEVCDSNLLYGYSHKLSSFRAQMEWLSDRFQNSTLFGDKNSFVVTFDDCSVHTFEQALPVLEEFGLKAYFFVVERDLGKPLWVDQYFFWLSYVPAGTYNILGRNFNIADNKSRLRTHLELWTRYEREVNSTEMLKALENAYSFKEFSALISTHHKRLTTIGTEHIASLKSQGHFVGFHSRSHERLSILGTDKLQRECSIQDVSLFNCETFAIPYGSPDDYNDQVLNQIYANGFEQILLNHPAKPCGGIFGRINLPDTGNVHAIEFHTRRYLNAIK